MNRNKLRFEHRLHRRRWEKEYWSQYHASMWQGRRVLTTEEHLDFWNRHHRETVQKINGICGKPIKRIV
jgi:hypothetical protein